MPPAAFRGSNFDPVAELSGLGFRPESGFRTQRHQDSLRAQGLTNTVTGSHQRGDGLDLVPPRGMAKVDAIALVKQRYPGARAIPSNGGAIHVTFPGWGRAPDISGSRRRFGATK